MNRWLFHLPGKCYLFFLTCACCVQYMGIDIHNDKMLGVTTQDRGWAVMPRDVVTYFTLKDDLAGLQEANLLSNGGRRTEWRAWEVGGRRVCSAYLVLSKAVRMPPSCPRTSLNLLHVRTNNTLQSLKQDISKYDEKDLQSTSWDQYAGKNDVLKHLLTFCEAPPSRSRSYPLTLWVAGFSSWQLFVL